MQLPVDIPELLKIATDLKEVRDTPIAISIFIDDSAPGELTGHVRAAFASSAARTRVMIEYLGDDLLKSSQDDDFAVIVAGESLEVGKQAQTLREAGIPTMIVSNDPIQTQALSEEGSCPLPAADVVAPLPLAQSTLRKVAAKLPFIPASESDEVIDGPIELSDEALKRLDARMGEWIITACAPKKLAMAYAFPFVRKPLASDSVTATALQNAAIGFVPILPGADMPIMTLNQAKMVLQIATAYGQPLDTDRIKELAAVVAGGFIARNIARSVTKVIPFAGWIVSGSIGFAATEAMGRAAMEYFEAGGDIVGLASVVQTARDGAVKTAQEVSKTPAGKRVAQALGDAMPKVEQILNKK